VTIRVYPDKSCGEGLEKACELLYQGVWLQTRPPERNLKGSWFDSLTAVKNAHVEGIHLRLPGYSEDGPTLEVFQYSPSAPSPDFSYAHMKKPFALV
jgi:hypothetical protein